MPYFEDNSICTYIRNQDGELFSVGWLSHEHSYPQGECPPPFLDRLFELCLSPVNLTRGHHVCDLCPAAGVREYRLADGRTIRTTQLIIQRDGVDLSLGNGEIHVRDSRGRGYAAPTMVYHYVEKHRYLPPDGFIEAINLSEKHS
jgi:hypothetical protein